MVGIYIWINRVLDLFLRPLEGHPLWALTAGAVVMGVAAMLIYKYTSSQAGIKDAKDKIKGHFYEVWLYIDDAAVIGKAQGQICYHALRYLGFAIPPLVIMIVLFFPLFANFETRYAMRSARPGEEVMVKLRLQAPFEGWQEQEFLALPPQVAMVGHPVRFIRKIQKSPDSVAEKRRDFEVDYKLRPQSAGEQELKFTVKGVSFAVPLAAGQKFGKRVSPAATQSLGLALLYPPLVTIPEPAGVERIEIKYPEAKFSLLGFRTWWVWPFLMISLVAALAVKGVFKVEI